MLEQLGDGVWAWIQPGGGSGISNAGVVEDEDGLTIIDTLMVPSQWQPFVAAVAEIGRATRRVVLTSADIDHVGGTTGFPMAGVYGSPATSALLDQPMMTDGYKAFMPAFGDEFDLLAEVGTRKVTHEIHGPVNLTPRLEILPVTGHTAGDLMALVADAEVLFAGDLCTFGVTPLAFKGNPAIWADMLDAVADLADVIVPGHGPIGEGEGVRNLQAYLRACVEAAGDPAKIPPGPWDAWTARERDEINVERAAMLAAGAPPDSMPPSMLRAIGMTP